MREYLSYRFKDNEEFINTFDELPLWSASFGLLLLKHLELKQGITVLDIGSGTGFPLMELAGRLGNSSRLYGIDPWFNANKRARQKIKNYELSNVEIIETSADNIPFEDRSVDLIVSNLGINNFEKPELIFKECCRVLKPGGRMAITSNLNGHWKTFYLLFEETLFAMGKHEMLERIKKEQAHRGSIQSLSKLFTDSGFRIHSKYEESFVMKFTDGSAFLNHHFVKLGWLAGWMELLPEEEIKEIFVRLEDQLNIFSSQSGGLNLDVPMAYIEGEKI